MEGLKDHSPFAQKIGESSVCGKFALLDIGCAGGIDGAWRCFGDRLIALGFDPKIDECKRLSRIETHAGIRYIPAFVGLPSGHPLTRIRRDRSYWAHNPWNRLSIYKTLNIRRTRQESTRENDPLISESPRDTVLADPNRPLVLQDYLAGEGLKDIDFVKIDVDGPDFDILRSIQDELMTWQVLGVGLEVNYYGSDHPQDHTFHNTDRLMRALGFDIFNLSTRRYSNAAMPSRYASDGPDIGEFGRPYQGDALYVRDLCRADLIDLGKRFGASKLAKLAALFALAGLPDAAAEVLLCYREELASALDIKSLLNVLLREARPDLDPHNSYEDYIAAFDSDDPLFYPPMGPSSAPKSIQSLLKPVWNTLPVRVLRKIRRSLLGKNPQRNLTS